MNKDKIETIPFDPKHLDEIELKQDSDMGQCPNTVLTSAFTLVYRGKIIAILGAFPFVPGVLHFWAMLSKHIDTCPLAFQRECKRIIAWYEKVEKPRRIQWEVLATFRKGQRWATSLGLECEGLMHAWGQNGEDYYLFARVNRCHQ